MPYDPNLPQAGREIDADQMRAQLNGLKDLIDALVTVNAAAVDATVTLPPNSAATVSVSVTGTTLHFTFGIPASDPGADDGGPTRRRLWDQWRRVVATPWPWGPEAPAPWGVGTRRIRSP